MNGFEIQQALRTHHGKNVLNIVEHAGQQTVLEEIQNMIDENCAGTALQAAHLLKNTMLARKAAYRVSCSGSYTQEDQELAKKYIQ